MKKAGILLVGIVIGYFIFSLLNPTPTETFTVKTRTIKQTNTVPTQVRDTRYHAPDSEIAPKPEPAEISIKAEPVTETKTEVLNPAATKQVGSVLPKKKVQFDFKTFVGINQIPFLLGTDPRIVKIQGQYSGTLKFLIPTGTTDVSKVVLKISENETIMTVTDDEDHIDENYTFIRSSSEVFKLLPEDPNLMILVTNSDNSMVFDLKALPVLKGKAYSRTVQFGEVELKKKQEKK